VSIGWSLPSWQAVWPPYIISRKHRNSLPIIKLQQAFNPVGFGPGIALREAIYNECLEGRLIAMDIFEPFFLSSTPLDKNLSEQEIVELAKKELRDVLPIQIAHLEQEVLSEAAIEQVIARYITLYKENCYLRVVHDFTNNIFRTQRRNKVQPLYVALFKLAGRICSMTHARREEDTIELDYYAYLIKELQKDIPFLDMKKITTILENGTCAQWQEMADYVDIFFLTLKQHYPLPLEINLHFTVKESLLAWLKEEPPSMYEEYFLSLLQEEYKKARTLKQAIDTYHASQSIKECH
jgi:hypothetical protein